MFYPAIRCGVVGVIPELRWLRRSLELRGAPRVLDRSVERRPGQVEASPGYLRLQPGEQAQALRVALEPAAASGEQRQGQLTVVPERRVSQVVGQACGVHQVRVTPELGPELPPDLRALQRVGEPGPREVARAHLDHLGLCGEPAQRGGVQHPGPVADEGPAAVFRRRVLLPWLGCPARGRGGAVARARAHRVSLTPAVSRSAARLASSRATGTLKGEQDT